MKRMKAEELGTSIMVLVMVAVFFFAVMVFIHLGAVERPIKTNIEALKLTDTTHFIEECLLDEDETIHADFLDTLKNEDFRRMCDFPGYSGMRITDLEAEPPQGSEWTFGFDESDEWHKIFVNIKQGAGGEEEIHVGELYVNPD